MFLLEKTRQLLCMPLLLLPAVLLTILGAGLFWWTYCFFPFEASVDGKSFNKGENGLWLRYLWYAGDAKYWSSVSSMIEHLNNEQVRYAYFHVRELKPDGTLALKYEERGKVLTDFVHSKAPNSKAIAWVSLGGAYPAKGTELADASVRKNAVAEAIWLTEKCQFDGIQWDFEPCPSGNKDFLSLLEETRVAIRPEKIISVATPMCVQAGEASTWYSWDSAYFSEVAKRSDQLAVMCYDLVIVFPWQYVNAVKKQVPVTTNAVAASNQNCRLIFGLPAYERGFLHDHCETLRLGLKAIREGNELAGTQSSALAGTAIFADYTTDENEWELYRKFWLNK